MKLKAALLLYLLDTSVLIEAKNQYYPLDRIPQFWAWILEQSNRGRIKIPTEVLTEIRRGSKDDPLYAWITSHGEQLALQESPNPELLNNTLAIGYGFETRDLAAAALPEMGADPFLVACALSNPFSRRVVTREQASVSPVNLPLPQNRKIPLACALLNIQFINTFDLIRELDFRIPL